MTGPITNDPNRIATQVPTSHPKSKTGLTTAYRKAGTEPDPAMHLMSEVREGRGGWTPPTELNTDGSPTDARIKVGQGLLDTAGDRVPSYLLVNRAKLSTDPDELRHLSESGEADVVVNIIQNTNTRELTVNTLLSAYPQIESTVADVPWLEASTLRQLAGTWKHPATPRKIIRRPRLDADTVNEYARQRHDRELRSAAREHPKYAPRTLIERLEHRFSGRTHSRR